MKLKNLSLLLLAALSLAFFSCKKETVDITDLLTTVPSSSAGVVVFNMESMLQDAGCKIKNHVITPGKEIKAMLENISNEDKEDFLMFFNGDTGIETKGLVMFYDSGKVYLTFALYDVNKFTAFVERKTGAKFEDQGSGVRINGTVAVKGAQAWICTSRRNIDPEAIENYSSLATSQSFIVNPNGEKLLTEENDIRGWALIKTFAGEFFGRSEISMFTLGMGFVFEDAESLRFKVDFKKGEIESETKVLNSKAEPAKYLLPAEKIDVNTLKTLGGTCDAMMAFTVNQKLIKKFQQLGSAFGGSLFGDLGDAFNNVDGTVGVVTGNNQLSNIKGVITTKGSVSQSLKDLLSNWVAPVSQDGKYLLFSKGEVAGNLDVEWASEELKGCCLGFAMDVEGLESFGYSENVKGFKNLVLKMKPEDGGLEAELEVYTVDPNENALLTLLKNNN